MASDGVGEILKWGLILGGGYLAWSLWESYNTVAAAPAPAAAPPATTPPVTTPAAAPVVAVNCPVATCPPTGGDSIATQTAKIMAAAGSQAGGTSQTASVWNYWFNVAYNLPQTTSWLLGDNGQPMTLAAYLALRQSLGFSGLGGLRGVRIPILLTPQTRARNVQTGYRFMQNRSVSPARSNYVRSGTPMS